jgi:hypothetical protein
MEFKGMDADELNRRVNAILRYAIGRAYELPEKAAAKARKSE